MTSTRPYLLRAIYEWIVDNGCTPHVLVDATLPGVQVPAHTVRDGQVVLNIAAQAVERLELRNEDLRFHARFSGAAFAVSVPINAVLAVYARENGQGMMFPAESIDDAESHAEPLVSVADGSEDAPGSAPRPERGKPSLRIVK